MCGTRSLAADPPTHPRSLIYRAALFSGTIRKNLDPFNNYTDVELWKALRGCEMEKAVKAMEGGLSAAVSEYGENLSQARPLLNRHLRQLIMFLGKLCKKCTFPIFFAFGKRLMVGVRL